MQPITSQALTPPPFTWSPRHRHSDLSISNYTTLFRSSFCMPNDAGFTAICAITRQPVSESTTKNRWGFKVLKVKQYLFAGICLRTSVITHGFLMWPWNDMGFGHYALGSEFEVYSQSDENINLQKVGFDFVKGDTVWCEYAKGRLMMVKNQGKRWYEMKVEELREGEEYVPCVYLVDVGDAVEIVPGVDVEELVQKWKEKNQQDGEENDKTLDTTANYQPENDDKNEQQNKATEENHNNDQNTEPKPSQQ